MSRPLSTSSTATATTMSGHARTASVKTIPKPQAVNPIQAPDIRLFVTNLRLLDFDLRPDWPEITIQTFSAKNADQRQRIGGAEWALFRLFEIWDPNETAQKLQPFFPPLEPLQSLNLRAALYRCLNELKKNGVLGRESVLRKTMLDECKGEKFYEILAIFSNAVLKKVLAAQDGGDRDAVVARKLATASTLSVEQQRSLLPLAIAHKAALVNVLKQKEEKRLKYMEFHGLLDKKAADIRGRIRKCKDTPRAQKPAIPQKEANAIKKQLKDNWVGNQQWLDVMLRGENMQADDAFLNSRFDKVLHMVEKGRKLEDVAPETGLLENLQARVQEQQERLQKWKAFHAELQSDESGKEISGSGQTAAPVKEFRFDDHSQHQLPSAKHTAESASVKRPTMRIEFQDILSDMDSELARAAKVRASTASTIIHHRSTSTAKAARPPLLTRKSTQTEAIRKAPVIPAKPVKLQSPSRPNSLENVPVLPLPRPSRHVPTVATPTDSDATLIGQSSTLSRATTRRDGSPTETDNERTPVPETRSAVSEPVVDTSSSEATKTLTNYSEQKTDLSPEKLLEPSPEYPSEPPIPTFDPPELNAEEALADQIINSIGNATPSPVKKPQPRMSLSLIERTRMTMARANSFEPVPESPDLPLPSMGPPPIPSITGDEDGDRRATLLERTRLTMEAMQSNPRPSVSNTAKKEHRKSSRQSLFPVNQFDTPRNRKSFELLEQAKLESIERTPTEQLFSDEVDYDRVFKSRPKIATSPVWSPEGGVGGQEEFGSDDGDVDGVTGIDLGDVDQDDDGEDRFKESWMDSPSHKKGVRSMRY